MEAPFLMRVHPQTVIGIHWRERSCSERDHVLYTEQTISKLWQKQETVNSKREGGGSIVFSFSST